MRGATPGYCVGTAGCGCGSASSNVTQNCCDGRAGGGSISTTCGGGLTTTCSDVITTTCGGVGAISCGITDR